MNNFNPWHNLSCGENAPEVVTSVIEIPANSSAKYELHKESGMLVLDRTMSSAMHYPANYGFIPQTYCDDKDPLDILVVSEVDIQPLCITDARVVGLMRMVDGGEMDDKIIAVADGDRSLAHVKEMSDLSPQVLARIKNFFETYKLLEKKKVTVEDFEDRAAAMKVIEESIQMYKDNF
jgi:inorganic pyrophosphatase